jgi:hypothetical protein
MTLAPDVLLTVWERGRRAAPLDRAVLLLAAVAGIGPAEAAGWDVGSRDVVLARALAGLGGSPVWGAVSCGACEAELDVPVDVDAIAEWPVVAPGCEYRAGPVVFRLPSSADLAAVRGLPPAAARDLIMAGCVVGGLADPDLAVVVEAAMEEYAPAAALSLAVACPDCSAGTSVAFDAGALLWAEVSARAVELLRDVHVLASAYGWTEPEVLALGERRRAAYLELVTP